MTKKLLYPQELLSYLYSQTRLLRTMVSIADAW